MGAVEGLIAEFGVAFFGFFFATTLLLVLALPVDEVFLVVFFWLLVMPAI